MIPQLESVIIFANRRDQVRWLYEKLRKEGVQCGMLSGEITQAKRTKTLENFKSGRSKILVATDVAGRGIHVEGISHAVNYNLPEDPKITSSNRAYGQGRGDGGVDQLCRR